MAKPKIASLANELPADTCGLSTAGEPLERLCSNAESLVKTVWYLVSRRQTAADDFFLSTLLHFTERLRAVYSQGEPKLIDRLRQANPHAVTAAGRVAESYVDLAANIAREVYRALLRAESGEDAEFQWLLNRHDQFHDIDPDKLKQHWGDVGRFLSALPAFDQELLAIEIEKEFWRAKGDSEPMTEPMTKGDIARYFSVGRNAADQVLAKYPHERINGKYRLRLVDMPPKYHAAHVD